MSVVKSLRKQSDVDFLNNAYKINAEITNLINCNFGCIPNKGSKDLKVFLNNTKMIDKDKELFSNIVKEYNVDVETSSGLYLLEKYRENLLNLSMQLIYNISDANNIIPVRKTEVFRRRDYQSLAISTCNKLLFT